MEQSYLLCYEEAEVGWEGEREDPAVFSISFPFRVVIPNFQPSKVPPLPNSITGS